MSPGGAAVNSQGRKPLVTELPFRKPCKGESDGMLAIGTFALAGLLRLLASFPGACAPGYGLPPLRG